MKLLTASVATIASLYEYGQSDTMFNILQQLDNLMNLSVVSQFQSDSVNRHISLLDIR